MTFEDLTLPGLTFICRLSSSSPWAKLQNLPNLHSFVAEQEYRVAKNTLRPVLRISYRYFKMQILLFDFNTVLANTCIQIL